MNPQTGELLALASSPGFNPNIFLPLGDSAERLAVVKDTVNLPLYNRAIQAFYPPGSTFKPISALAALQKPSFDPRERVFCPGSFTLGKEKRVFKCWKQPHGHGSVDFLSGMAQSCDVYFYQMGLKIGPRAIEDVAIRFGLGKKTDIDLPNEKSSALPMAWKETRARAIDRYWAGGETLNYVIGQGALQVTPLQMANVAAMLANKGTLWQPYLASQTQRFGEAPRVIGNPRVVLRSTFPDSHWNLLQKSMLEVVQAGSGTGIAARIKGIAVAGKTGTAQASKGDDHAWFIAFAPLEQPTVACAVLVEHGGHGGAVAAPIAHDLLAKALGVEEGRAVGEGVRGD
jgi:penicillin-binding protein 2